MEDEAVYAHTLSGPPAEKVASIFEKLNIEEETEAMKKAFERVHSDVLEKTVRYMKEEYVQMFEQIAMEQARRMVAALLKGDPHIARSFGLIRWNEDCVLDSDGVLDAVFERFKDQIADAKLISMQSELKHLRNFSSSWRYR